MPAGIEVFNTNGSLQITEDYRNIQLLEKITISGSGYVVFNVDDLIAFRAESGGWGTIYPWYLGYPNNAVNGSFHFTGTSTMTVYRFGHASILSGHFLEVYDANGVLTFSDGAPTLKVITQVSGSYSIGGRASNGAQISVTSHSPDYKAAVVIGNLPGMYGAYNTEETYGVFNATMGFTFNTDNITTNVVVLRDYSRSINFATRYPIYNFLVVNVTNY